MYNEIVHVRVFLYQFEIFVYLFYFSYSVNQNKTVISLGNSSMIQVQYVCGQVI